MYRPVAVWEKVMLMLYKSSQSRMLFLQILIILSILTFFLFIVSYDVLNIVFNIFERN